MATSWTLDPTHSEIGFKVKHMMFTNVSGKIDGFSATVQTEGDSFENAQISFSADLATLATGNPDRDNHLKSADFFDTEKFPTLRFEAKEMKKVNEGMYQLTGDLTIKDVTQSVTLEAEYSGLMKDPWGNTKAGFTLNGKINRKEFGLLWNVALETGGVLVGEDVKLNIEVQLVKQA